jgi:hypothetical protein
MMFHTVNPFLSGKRQMFFAILLLLLFFVSFDLKATIKKYDETVSLGTACQSAWHLEANEIRKWAYPFDWLITPFESLMIFMESRGAGFLDKDQLTIVETLHGHPSMLHVVNLAYNIHFIHDFLAPDMFNYDAVKEKYDRRIKRFFDLLESNKKVLFIRVQISRPEAECLDNYLHTHYPNLDYTLVAVSEDSDARSDWGLERVRNFYMQQIPGNWMGNGEKWREILSQFPVREAKKKRPREEKW